MHDYIVIGTGAGGSVVAGRLTDDPDASVLVIEAGEMDNAPEIEMPLAAGALIRGRHDWDFTSETEFGLDERTISVPRGRVIGGTTVLNGTIYTRGQPRDYDDWAADGVAGWSYAEMLPYFKLAEDNERGANAFHGAGGPLTVSDTRSAHPLCAAFIEAAEQAGEKRNDDFSGPKQEGVGWFQLMQRDGRRLSAAKAYLHPALERQNLTLLTSTKVLRILFEGDRAVGVETWRDGEITEHRAAKEVIVCAGAIQSPQILMLSGIGPVTQLEALGIEVRADLPVGENLQDHNNLVMVGWTDEESLLTAFTPENFQRFQEEGQGPLTSNAAEAGAFLIVKDGQDEPDFELHGIAAAYLGPNIVRDHGVSIAGYPTYAASRGTVTLRTTDPFSKPRIHHNYLAEDEDRVTFRAGVRRMLEIFEAPALSSIVTGFADRPKDDSDEEVDAFIRRRADCGNHHAGTCAMGSVLDEELRVRGIEGLRVMDASVMPTLVRGNPAGVIIAMAEKASDLIRGVDRTAAQESATAVGAV